MCNSTRFWRSAGSGGLPGSTGRERDHMLHEGRCWDASEMKPSAAAALRTQIMSIVSALNTDDRQKDLHSS